MEHPDPSQLFVHVRIAMGIVLGLSITRLLAGLARIVQHPGREKIYPLHLAWVFAVLLFVIDFWWWEFRLSALPRFTFALFVFVVFYASLFYFLCALLFPDDIKDYAGYEDYFMSRRLWFFGILALTAIADVAGHALQGLRLFPELWDRVPGADGDHHRALPRSDDDPQPALPRRLRRREHILPGELDFATVRGVMGKAIHSKQRRDIRTFLCEDATSPAG